MSDIPKHERLFDSDYRFNNFDIHRAGDELSVNLTYPGVTEGGVRFVEINQESVRASDGIRLCYDYSRDGWSVQQPTRTAWEADDEGCDEGWRETAFVRSWHFEADQERHKRELYGEEAP